MTTINDLNLYNAVQEIKAEYRVLQELHSRTEKNMALLTSTIAGLSNTVAVLSEKYKIFVENKKICNKDIRDFKEKVECVEHELNTLLTNFKTLEISQENSKEKLNTALQSQAMKSTDLQNTKKAVDLIKRSLLDLKETIKILEENQKKNSETLELLKKDKDKVLTVSKFVKWLAAGIASLIGVIIGIIKFFSSQ